MNLILFEPGEWEKPLPLQDRRAEHIRQILKLKPGDLLLAGEIGGNWGTLTFNGQSEQGLSFASPDFSRSPAQPYPLGLLIGTPRPPTAQRLLRDLTSLGVARLVFAATDLGEKSYLQSHLWQSDWKKALADGAMQAKTTLLPQVERFDSLGKALQEVFEPHEKPTNRLVFDPSGESLSKTFENFIETTVQTSFAWAALGPERGWSEREKGLLKSSGWSFVNLGERVLRTETACTVAVSLILNRVLGIL
ncbi:MAG: RsmE family RNA methyltransferase [Spirochaetales bacterium]|nr:RsmE family RNA methyltransferase [Spirochaetales bacterium]